MPMERCHHENRTKLEQDENLSEQFQKFFLNNNFFADSDTDIDNDDDDDDDDRQQNDNGIDDANNLYKKGEDKQQEQQPSRWIFAYGSLCWNPGFEFDKCITGYINGYVRRFWQGNTVHRGTKEKPGRVATLVNDRNGRTWGCAYRINGQTALDYLKQRECTLGGYDTLELKFYPRIASHETSLTGECLPVLVYIANEMNENWLGEDELQNIANQIVECRGQSGHNVEYVIRLARFMHEELPDANDEHLFNLENLVLQALQLRQIPLISVMGKDPVRIQRDSYETTKRTSSFDFTSRLPERKLRCLNI